MSSNVVLNLLIKCKKSDKIQGLPKHLSHFCNKCNRFNNTGARMLDSMTVNLNNKSSV